jgi:hypothetical protein
VVEVAGPEESFAAADDVSVMVSPREPAAGPESLSVEAASKVWDPAAVRYGFGSNSRVRADRARQDLDWCPRNSSIFHDLPREAALHGQL